MSDHDGEVPRRRSPAALGALMLAAALGGGGVVAVVDRMAPGAPSGVAPIPTPSVLPGRTVDVHQVLTAVEQAVVAVRTDPVGPTSLLQPVATAGSATGVVIASDGVVLTAAPAVAGARAISVELPSGRTLPARLLGVAADSDVAVLKVAAQDLPVVVLGNSATLQVGDPVMALGDALALPGGPTVSDGIVSALDRTVGDGRGDYLEGVIQTDATIDAGNTGGPLVDGSGRLVGLCTAIDPATSGVGFAAGITRALPSIVALEGGHPEATPFLDAQTTTETPQLQAQFGLGVPSGALVLAVDAGGAAAAAGLRTGDVVTALDGRSVRSADDLYQLVQGQRPGDQVDLTVERGHRSTLLVVRLGSLA